MIPFIWNEDMHGQHSWVEACGTFVSDQRVGGRRGEDAHHPDGLHVVEDEGDEPLALESHLGGLVSVAARAALLCEFLPQAASGGWQGCVC